MAQIIKTKSLEEIETHISAKDRRLKELANGSSKKRDRITNQNDKEDLELGTLERRKKLCFQLRDSWTLEEFG